MTPEDTQRLEGIRAKLYNFVASSQEENEDVVRARGMLAKMPKGPAIGMSLGSQPPVAPDAFSPSDVKGDYGKRDLNRTVQGRQDLITNPEDRSRLSATHAAEDPIKNDPLAGMIVQGIPAAATGGAVGGVVSRFAPFLSRFASGATAGAMSSPDDPLLGAALGAFPGAPSAIRGAVPIAKEVATHAVKRVVGQEGIDAIAKQVARRPAPTYSFPESVTLDELSPPAAPRLAPLTPEGPALPAKVPPGFPRAPAVDEITGEPLTNAGPSAATHATVGGKTAPNIKPPPSVAYEKTTPAGLRSDVVRDADKFRNAPPEPVPSAAGSSLEDKLARSVKILDDLKTAKANGTLTVEMEQAAIDAGIPSANVSRAIGGKLRATTDNPIVSARKQQIRQDAKNARILSGRVE